MPGPRALPFPLPLTLTPTPTPTLPLLPPDSVDEVEGDNPVENENNWQHCMAVKGYFSTRRLLLRPEDPDSLPALHG